MLKGPGLWGQGDLLGPSLWNLCVSSYFLLVFSSLKWGSKVQMTARQERLNHP